MPRRPKGRWVTICHKDGKLFNGKEPQVKKLKLKNFFKRKPPKGPATHLKLHVEE